MAKRVIWIILDSVGIGALPDAAEFGDEGTNTFSHVYEKCEGLKLPNMKSLGIFNIEGVRTGVEATVPKAAYARAAEISRGKDTTIGHWEMTGIHTSEPFPVYPEGFPDYIIDEFIRKTGVAGILGNEVASGTEIIKRLGAEHVKTGFPIIYTSADSVFQIAAHEEVISVDRLYELCEIARGILTGRDACARVIARPFVGQDGEYTRTSNRRDFSLKPTRDNLLCYLQEAGHTVTGVGKIEDIFAGVGISNAIHTRDNRHGMEVTMELMESQKEGLIFTNLVEFDSKWGHRNDYEGYGQGLEEFDAMLLELMDKLQGDDLLVINADHGCDPTTPGTDHTREYVPVLMYRKDMSGCDMGTMETFADIGQTIGDYLGCAKLKIGKSYLDRI